MGDVVEEDALRRLRFGVRAEADPGQLHLAAQVVLGHAEVHGEDAALVLDDEVDQRVGGGVAAALLHDVGEGHALQRLHVRLAQTGQQDVLRRQHEAAILPVDAWLCHLRGDAGAHGGVAQTFDQGRDAAFVGPGRDAGIEAGAGEGVGVHVSGERQAFRARRLDGRDGQFPSCASYRRRWP